MAPKKKTDSAKPTTPEKEETAVAQPKPVAEPKKSGKEPQTMEELLSMTGYTLKGFKKGSTVNGVVTNVTPREVLIDIGGKTDGVVIDRELELYRDALMALKPGEAVTATVIVSENDRGQAVLSLRKSIFERHWQELAEAKEKGTLVEVVVKDQVRGGMLVDYSGLRGYIPQSQIDSSVIKQNERPVHKRINAKVIEVDRDANRLVFSQRAASEEQTLSRQKELLSEVEVGSTIQATITGVVAFGAFAKFSVTKDGKEQDVEGLIHISEIAWEKVEDPNQYLKTGDSIKVKVIGVDADTGKLTLSLKQLLPDPWEHVLDIFEKDTQVKGTVTRATPYGVFVALSPGIEGLIHISKISPGEEPKSGDEITCTIEDIQPEKRKISLSMSLTEKPIGYR